MTGVIALSDLTRDANDSPRQVHSNYLLTVNRPDTLTGKPNLKAKENQ